jgi:hydrogenase nickel incorporation protein HypA/HybF
VHELSICRSIADIVARHAGDRPVQTVHLQVGALRQIVPETLVYCWSLLNESSGLAGSQLAVQSIPAAIRCRSCGRSQRLDAPILVCAGCGSGEVEIVAGEEFLITSLELAEV